MLGLLYSGKLDDADFVECLRNADGSLEALIVNIDVPLGQKKTENDIRSSEPLAIVFATDSALPAVYPLRKNFPFRLPHVNVAPEGFPQSLCLSDQPHEDQLRGYTAAKFLSQIRWWLVQTAYGKLHGDEQPLDPMFHMSPVNIIASGSLSKADYAIGVRLSEHDAGPIVLSPLSANEFARVIGQPGLMTPLFIKTDSVPHGQLNSIPRNIHELLKVYSDIGATIFGQLGEALIAILGLPHQNALLNQPTVMVLKTEIKAPDGRVRLQQKAFVTPVTSGEIGQTLGIMSKAGGAWARLLMPTASSDDALKAIAVESADLHPHFSRSVAALASGYEHVVETDIVLIGAGAVGSHVAMNLARGGIGKWHIVDDDFILPHNQARYALEPDNVGSSKADALTLVIRRLLEDFDAATPHLHRLGYPETPDDLIITLKEAETVIDASASVPVARSLAFDDAISGRVCSVFMNPAGSDGVMLQESIGRSVRIDCVEMHYYWMIGSRTELTGHLNEAGQPLPVGGCRSPSARIPETQVSLLSSLLAGRWLKDRETTGAEVVIWRGASDFETITSFKEDAPQFIVFEAGGWTIKLSDRIWKYAKELRQAIAPKETGGIIVGSWDRQRQTLYLVGIFDAPPNSVHSNTGFERGSVGVFKTIQELEDSTLGNLTYVGEWHSHPPGVNSIPSSDDKRLLKWIGHILDEAEAPAIMMIVGDDGLRIILKNDKNEHQVLLEN